MYSSTLGNLHDHQVALIHNLGLRYVLYVHTCAHCLILFHFIFEII